MYIIIESKNQSGTSAMQKLMEASSMGIATKTIVSESPYTIKITPKGIQRYIMVLKNNPYIIDVIEQPMKQVLIDYGASPNDFDLKAVF